jgi:hypothetical protein
VLYVIRLSTCANSDRKNLNPLKGTKIKLTFHGVSRHFHPFKVPTKKYAGKPSLIRTHWTWKPTPRHNHNCRWTQATPGRACYCAHPADFSNASGLAPRLRGHAGAVRVLLEERPTDQIVRCPLYKRRLFLAQTPRLRGLDRHRRRLIKGPLSSTM